MADVVNVLARRARPGWARWAFDRKGETWQLRHAEISWGRSLPVIKLEYGSIATSCWSSRKQPFHRSQLRSRVRRFASDAAPYGRLLSITRPSECDCKATLTMADIGYRGPSPRYEVTRQDASSANTGNDPLVSLDSPSFANYQAALPKILRT